MSRMFNVVYLNSTKTFKYIECNNARVFYSYDVPIAVWFYGDCKAYKAKKKYSVTTSKHCGQIHKYLNDKVIQDIDDGDFNNKINLVKY